MADISENIAIRRAQELKKRTALRYVVKKAKAKVEELEDQRTHIEAELVVEKAICEAATEKIANIDILLSTLLADAEAKE